MKITINPKYNDLTTFVESIPDIFDKEGTLIYEARNQLKAYEINGLHIIVKSFKRPHLINRIAYTFFRPSKAKRSYEYAFKLLEKGIATPEPIAYIEKKKNGLLDRSFYIAIFENEYSEIRDQMFGINIDDAFIKNFVALIASLHEKGILNKDLSPGNVLFKKNIDGGYKFILVDINRMKFLEKISKKKRYQNFKRLTKHRDIINNLAREYASITHLDEKECMHEINKYSFRFSKNNLVD